MELMDTCLGKLLTQLKPNPFPEDVIGKVVIAVVTALDYLKTNFSVIHRGTSVCAYVCSSVNISVCMCVSPFVLSYAFYRTVQILAGENFGGFDKSILDIFTG